MVDKNLHSAASSDTPVAPLNSHRQGVLAYVINFCARNTLLTLLLVLAASFWGYRSMSGIALDAIPDLSDPQVIVFTEWPGRSPDLVEDQITYPLTTALLAAPKVKFVRGQSFFGLSFVYVIFEEGTDIYWGRSRVLEYLNTAASRLPSDVSPMLGPDATGVGWVFQYALKDVSGKNSLADLRSLQDFNLRYALESVDGVAEVASVGGYQKEYQVDVDPARLASYNIPLQKVVDAVRRSNSDVGGRVLEISGHEQFIRGRGYVKSTADIEKAVLATNENGVPIRVSDVATVSLGPAMQRGSADLNGEGLTVGGIVVMRYGENALAVINRVKARLAELKSSLPAGVEIVTVYDRSSLIERSIETLSNTLAEEMLIVSVVIFVFLLHFRSALVVVITLPIAILLAFIPLYYQGFSANIMSLGGIAVAIGAMVDAAIAIVENIHRRLGLWQNQVEDKREPRLNVLIDAMQEVGPSIFVALLIIALSFLPVFALQDSEGRLFKPLAWTKTYSMFFAALLAVTLIPALAVLLIKGSTGSDDNWLNRFLISAYTPVVRAVLKFRWPVVLLALVAVFSSIIPLQKLGKEFMPSLNEGSILYMPTALPGISIAEAQKTLQTMDSILKQFPEVENVFGKVGRSSSPTDSAPLSMIETNISLKPKDQWRAGMTWDKLIAEMDEKLQFPGIPNIWWMPIQTRTQMLATGIRSTLGIKVFGDDLAEIEATAIDIENALLEDERTASLTRSAFAERTTGGYFLDFDIDREAAARFGLNIADVQDVISAAVGGTTVSQTVEGRERYGIRVRYNRDYRNNIDALERIYITSSTGAQIPISQVAKLKFRTGPPMIRNEDGSLVGFVFVDVKDDIGVPDYVTLAKQVVGDSVYLPEGYRLAWVGQFESFERAKKRLSVLVPTTVLLIFFMLYFHRKSLFETAVIMLALPFSLIGSSWLLYALGYKLSVAVAVGMIAVAGLAIELGLLMVLYLDIAWRQAQANNIGAAANYKMLNDAIVEGAAKRLRPKLMTGLALFMGLLPLLYSTGTGADVMKRVAAPMLGGVGTSLLMVLIVFPAVYSLWHERSLVR